MIATETKTPFPVETLEKIRQLIDRYSKDFSLPYRELREEEKKIFKELFHRDVVHLRAQSPVQFESWTAPEIQKDIIKNIYNLSRSRSFSGFLNHVYSDISETDRYEEFFENMEGGNPLHKYLRKTGSPIISFVEKSAFKEKEGCEICFDIQAGIGEFIRCIIIQIQKNEKVDLWSKLLDIYLEGYIPVCISKTNKIIVLIS